MATVRPNSDVVTTGWIPSVGGAVYATIDETAYDESDYARRAVSRASQLIEGLNASVSPGTQWVVLRLGLSSGVGEARVQLMDSSSVVVGSSAWQTIDATPATYRFSVVNTGGAARLGIEIAPYGILTAENGDPILTEDGQFILID
jgi:hypothetical protein